MWCLWFASNIEGSDPMYVKRALYWNLHDSICRRPYHGQIGIKLSESNVQEGSKGIQCTSNQSHEFIMNERTLIDYNVGELIIKDFNHAKFNTNKAAIKKHSPCN